MAQSPKHPASEHHFLASAHHQAAAHHHLQAAHLHDLGQHEEAKEHATAAHEHSELAHKHTTTAHGHSPSGGLSFRQAKAQRFKYPAGTRIKIVAPAIRHRFSARQN